MRHGASTAKGNGTEITADVLMGTVMLSTDRCFPGQELAVALTLEIKPGWHIYGSPGLSSYQVLELTFDSPLLEALSLDLPAPCPISLSAIGQTLPVYEGVVRASGTVRVKWSPPNRMPFMEALGAWIEPGEYRINGTLRFQACRSEVCETPQAISFGLPLHIEAGVTRTPSRSG